MSLDRSLLELVPDPTTTGIADADAAVLLDLLWFSDEVDEPLPPEDLGPICFGRVPAVIPTWKRITVRIP